LDYSELQNKAKENIIKTAFQLFSENGIHNVALVQIAKESKIGVATVYRYFGNKKTIINECANYIWEEITKLVEIKISSLEFLKLTGIEKMEGLLVMFYDLYNNNKQYLKFISEYDAYIAQDILSPEEATRYNENFLVFHNIGLRFFEEGIKDNTIKSEIEFDNFYYSITRALLDVSMKGANSPILLETDKTVTIETQIKQLILMAIYYCKKGE
jgi:AcrR family transcriptional regulator